MMQDQDNSAGAKKALAKVQKMLQLVTHKRGALALRDYRETLEECLKTEASGTMKILGYRMASRVPTCTTHDVWQMLVEAIVMELASSQNAPVLLYAVPVLEQIPLPLVIGFFISSEKEPMNKLRGILQHDQSDVRCCAIATLAKVTIDVAISITHDGLFAFPFESHEARTVCQQDLWTLIADIWKIIYQSASLEAMPDVAGAAFTALRMLFARTSLLSHRFNVLHPPTNNQNLSAVNDLAAAVYKEAFPRVRALVISAQKLPVKYQVDAGWWLAMLLYMMLDRTGAQCPGVSVPYLEIDVVRTDPHDDDDDDDNQSTMERVRMDLYASEILTSWLVPLMNRKLPLAQVTGTCRSVFVLLSHSLLEFARLRSAPDLVHQLVAQCYFHKNPDIKLEMCHLLVRAFAWTSSNECIQQFVRVVETTQVLERESDRRELLQLVLDSIAQRTVVKGDFLLLESICAMEVFRQPSGTSKLSPRTNGSLVFCALVQSLVSNGRDEKPDPHAKERQVAQLITLKAFQPVLLYKTATVSTHSPEHESDDLHSYIALVVTHYQAISRCSELALRESLQFFRVDITRAWKQITSSSVRLQLLWIAIQLHTTYELVPFSRLVELVDREAEEALAARDEDAQGSTHALGHGAPTAAVSAAFDDGRFGGGNDEHGQQPPDASTSGHVDIPTIGVLVECLHAMAAIDPQQTSTLQSIQARLKLQFPASSLNYFVLDEPLTPTLIGPKGLMIMSEFDPASLFHPRRSVDPSSVPLDGPIVDHRQRALITGSSDPLALRVSYRQPVPLHEELIVLVVQCCNTSALALSDFEIHIRPQGPVRCVDPSNDLKLRIQQAGGGAVASSLPPFGVLRGEKRFVLTRFGQATFHLSVVFREAESAGGEEGATGTGGLMRLAPCDPYALHLDALFRRPPPEYVSRGPFQAAWMSAQETVVMDVRAGPPSLGESRLSLAQRVVQRTNPRVAVVAELLVDLPQLTQVSFVTTTRWDELVVATVTLFRATPATTGEWTGRCEIRSSRSQIHELARHRDVVVATLGGRHLELATAQASSSPTTGTMGTAGLGNVDLGSTSALRTSSQSLRTASRHLSSSTGVGQLKAAPATVPDPFAGGGDLTAALSGKWTPAAEQLRPSSPPSAAFGDAFGAFPATATATATAPLPSSASSTGAFVDAFDGGGFGAFTSTSTTTTANTDPWGF